RPVAQHEKKPAADDRAKAICDDELHEAVTNSSRSHHHQAANAREHSANTHNPDSPAIKEHLGLLYSFLGDMFADVRNLRDFQAVLFAEVIQHAVAADDPEPRDDRDDAKMQMPICSEISAEDQRNVLGKRQAKPAGKQQTEDDVVSADVDESLNGVEDRSKK